MCVDACNSVMDKVHLPRGLVRYATQNGMRQAWSSAQMLRRVLRPRVLVYSTVLLALCIAMLASLATRTPLKVDVVRDRAALARLVEGEQIENIYRLQVMNATEGARRYRIRGGCGPRRVALGAGAAARALRRGAGRVARRALRGAGGGRHGAGVGKIRVPRTPLIKHRYGPSA
jgi:polyferredoxin